MSRPHPDPLPQEREQHVTVVTTLSSFGIPRQVHGDNALLKEIGGYKYVTPSRGSTFR